MVVLNGRMSERSFIGWKKNHAMIWQLLRAFRLILAQSEMDAERFRALGAKAVETPGNLKFACAPLPVDSAALAEVSTTVGTRPKWLAASTHAGDEAMVGRTHLKLRAHIPLLLSIIVPRHPERGKTIATELTAQGLTVARRSLGQPIAVDTDVYLADTLGELGLFYRLCTVVFIGKSMPQQPGAGGGQNPIEPAQLDCALIFGPDMSNFTAVAKALLTAGGALEAADETELTQHVERLLCDPAEGSAMARAASNLTANETDALGRIMDALSPYFEGDPHARA